MTETEAEFLESIARSMDEWLDENDGGWEYYYPDWADVLEAKWYLEDLLKAHREQKCPSVSEAEP